MSPCPYVRVLHAAALCLLIIPLSHYHLLLCHPRTVICVGLMQHSCRWFVKRAAAIKRVDVSADLPSGTEGGAAMELLESRLPFLAGCLCKAGGLMELSFRCEPSLCPEP
jgi:hypothetical protein